MENLAPFGVMTSGADLSPLRGENRCNRRQPRRNGRLCFILSAIQYITKNFALQGGFYKLKSRKINKNSRLKRAFFIITIKGYPKTLQPPRFPRAADGKTRRHKQLSTIRYQPSTVLIISRYGRTLKPHFLYRPTALSFSFSASKRMAWSG